ncbi:hypothetical protein K7432_010982 [Basidiobolus ranarum]|uniref:Phosphatidic acid phosphatase type 2/haloperoxidase domain-containing protein n=1 Tax=Basidiobolus ranarum TaxID=34480 RepID=A0ABR2WN07_9FUNG
MERKRSMFQSDYPPGHLRKLTLSYLKDWIVVIVLTVGFFLIDKIPPFHRDFSLQNKSISYPFKEKEIVPIWLGAIFAFVVPLVVLVFIALAIKRSPYDCHNALLGLCLSLSLALMFTDVLKITVGRQRPDFIARCQVRYENGQPPQDPLLGLSTTSICTQTDEYIFKDGIKSFPSAHTSLGFGGLGFLSLYLAGKLHLFDERGHTYKSFLVALPLIGALLIGISRICDYRHHWSDVFIGAIIGLSTATFSYRQYYPSLGINRCDKPFSPRIPRPISKVVDTVSENDSLENPEQFSLPQFSASNTKSSQLHNVVINHQQTPEPNSHYPTTPL